MATAFLSTRPDISRLPSITGFAMFVSSTIHFKSLVAQRKLQKYGVGKLKAALSILERLKDHWRHLNDLVNNSAASQLLSGLIISVVSARITLFIGRPKH
jgi:transcriptional regulator of heat shock response